MNSQRRTDDTRAVTVPVNYVLLVGIAALLTMGMFTGIASFVTDQQRQAVSTGLEVAGNRLASDLTAADRLAGTVNESDTRGAIRLRIPLPETVAGWDYLIAIRADGTAGAYEKYDLVLTSMDGRLSQRIDIQTKRSLPTDRTFSGGTLVVSYNASADPTELEVRDG